MYALQGSYFCSDEKMTLYFVSNTKGSFVKEDFGGGSSEGGEIGRAHV